jgi:putative transposase
VIAENPDLLQQLTLQHACTALEVNRGSYYRFRKEAAGAAEATAAEAAAADPAAGGRSGRADPPGLRETTEQLCQEWVAYGYRRITRQLQQLGFRVNHKRILRRLRQWGWVRRPRRRWIGTTQAVPGRPIAPNLLAKQGWREMRRPNAAWVADLTYIPFGPARDSRFAYLAMVLDVYSRQIVGWAVARRADQQLVLRALDQALASRQPPLGWIHHSDQGGQYTSHAYQDRLRDAGARISMCRKGSPLENAVAESWMGTLKREEVEVQEYETYGAVEANIRAFIKRYNEERQHSALGYCAPVDYERMTFPDAPQ